MMQEPLVHDVPNFVFQRVLLTAGGLFAFLIAPYELWRGVWPLNAGSPFFAFIMLGGMHVGAAFIWAGLATPSLEMRLARTGLTLDARYLWGVRRTIVPAASIRTVRVETHTSSDSDDAHYAVIEPISGKAVHSRPLQSRQAAETLAEDFRQALGLAPAGDDQR